MRIIIKGKRGLKIEPRLREYTFKKINKFAKILPNEAVIEVVLEDIRGLKGGKDKTVRIMMTLPYHKNPFCVSEATSDFYGSVDLAEEKLEREIIKYKEKEKIGSRYPKKYFNK